MSKLKACIIGAGEASRVIHAPFLSVNPDIDLVAVCSAHKETASILAKRFHIKRAYDDYREMLDNEKPDLVNVTSPKALHAEHTIAALKCGADVLCEKPMANSLEDCQKMINTAKSEDAKLMIGLRKWNIGLEKTKEILDSGELGKPYYIYVHYTGSAVSRPHEQIHGKKASTIEEEVAASGGGVAAGMSHYLYNFRWILGDVRSVSGEIINTFPNLGSLENFAQATLKFLNGSLGAVVMGTGPSYNFGEVEKGGAYCTQGNIYFMIPDWKDFSAPKVLVQHRASDEWTQIPFKTDFINLNHYHFKREIDYWVNCVKNNIQPSPSGEDGKATQEIVFALYQSWYEGKIIELPLRRTPPLVDIFRKLREDSVSKSKL